MHQVTVSKDRLRTALTENRAAHVEAFDAVWEAFRKKAEADCHAMYQQIIDARKGDHIRLSLALQVPENHADDYDRALQMLDWEQESTVVLSEHEFAELIQDDWGWKRQFATTGFAYMGDTAALPGLRQSRA